MRHARDDLDFLELVWRGRRGRERLLLHVACEWLSPLLRKRSMQGKVRA